jgi:hypothetical protein
MARNTWKLSDDISSIRQIQNFGPLTSEAVTDLIQSVSHLMSEKHRDYLHRILVGEGEVDPLMDLETFFRVVHIYALWAVKRSLESGTTSKEIGSILGEVRQTAVAIDSMQAKRKLEKATNDDNEQGATDQESALSFLQSLDRRTS